MQNLRLFLLIGLVFGLSSCASAPPTSSQFVTIVNAGELPPPLDSDIVSDTRPYLIGPFDKLKIDVFGVGELQQETQVDASGRLSFPLIGSVVASGITPTQLAQEIAAQLRGRFVKDPQVTVNLLQTVSRVVTVDGQVAEPGIYPVVGNMTLMRAVATAGGTTEFAKLQEVIVFRRVEGAQMAGIYNLGAIRNGAYGDPQIYANDVVVVGDSQARRTFQRLIESAPLLTTPLILLTRL